jgi:hypothetical protein
MNFAEESAGKRREIIFMKKERKVSNCLTAHCCYG